jgi:hypothetical protein
MPSGTEGGLVWGMTSDYETNKLAACCGRGGLRMLMLEAVLDASSAAKAG